jgi:hypothetical protein
LAKTYIMTPVGVASFPHLDKPDTFKGATKYKTKLELDAVSFAKFKAEFEKKIEGQRFETKKPKLPWKDGEDGKFILSASSQYAPGIFDTKNQAVSTRVGGGSRIRLSCEIVNYGDGASLRLQQVQVIELQQGGFAPGQSAFDEVEDGFVAEASEFKAEEAAEVDALDI